MRNGLLFGVIVMVSAVAVAADWPQFLGPDRNNVSGETGLIRTFPAAGPKVLWKANLGVGYGGAAIRDGKAYLLDREGKSTDKLRCWDLEKGEELWSYAYEAKGKRLQYPGSRSVPAVDEKYAFTIGAYGHFHCIDLTTHKPVWSKNLLKDFGGKLPMWGVSQSPLLYKDLVIVAPSGPKVGVIAYKKATGKVAWQSGPIGGLTYASPMIAKIGDCEQIVVLGFKAMAATNAVGIDLANGKELWRYSDWGRMWPIPGPVDLGEGKLLLSGEYGAGMVVISVEKKGKTYSAKLVMDVRKAGSPYYASQIHQPIQIDHHLYFISNGFDKRNHGLVCLSSKGKVKWQTGKKPNFDISGAMLLADGKLFVLDGKTGKLHIVQPNSDSYKELDSAKVLAGKKIWAPMALSDGRLLLRDQKQLQCIDMRASK